MVIYKYSQFKGVEYLLVYMLLSCLLHEDITIHTKPSPSIPNYHHPHHPTPETNTTNTSIVPLLFYHTKTRSNANMDTNHIINMFSTHKQQDKVKHDVHEIAYA